jgi:hypothetical protein
MWGNSGLAWLEIVDLLCSKTREPGTIRWFRKVKDENLFGLFGLIG